ncbi:MAG: 1-acyl-sn-glycerol-3-phosphate acyltransferase [Chitinophagaceae bacterium]|nr:1-acyl-sn-glycerol-3-phosphate acyltransferase [Chitinophagaceae bacterium]
MKSIKKILGGIFIVWGMFVFVLSMLVFYIPMWAAGLWKEPKRTAIFIATVRAWMFVFLNLTGVRLSIKGREKFKKGENYIVVCNHNSMMDVPISSPGIPGANKTIAKIELSKIPLFGMIYKRGSILVDRDSEQSRKDSFQKMKAALELGMHVCLYPEGTRNKTGNPLKSFHDGAFRLAVTTGKSIVPAVIFNSGKVLPNNKSFFYWPQPIEMHFLDPIPVSENDSYTEIKQKVFDLMWNYIEQNKKD